MFVASLSHQWHQTISISVISSIKSLCNSTASRSRSAASHHFSMVTSLFMSPAALSVCLHALPGAASRCPPVKSTEGLGEEPAGPDTEPLGQNGHAAEFNAARIRVSAPLSDSLSICSPHSDCVNRESHVKGHSSQRLLRRLRQPGCNPTSVFAQLVHVCFSFFFFLNPLVKYWSVAPVLFDNKVHRKH